MTNQEILYSEIISNKLMTKKELDNYIDKNLKLPTYLTFVEWNKRGYRVKEGQKAVIKTKLWIRTKRKLDKTKEETEENIMEGFALVNTSLFSEEQVKKLEVE